MVSHLLQPSWIGESATSADRQAMTWQRIDCKVKPKESVGRQIRGSGARRVLGEEEKKPVDKDEDVQPSTREDDPMENLESSSEGETVRQIKGSATQCAKVLTHVQDY